jgi:hypothetical protein
MTDKQTPPDWVLIEAAKRCNYRAEYAENVRIRYDTASSSSFRALCDMIERYEQPPPDRKLLCAREALAGRMLRVGMEGSVSDIEDAIARAIELWEEGFGK